MKIVVCLKQVPDMEARFKVIDEKKIDFSQIAFKINDFDNYAIEAAIRLKEQMGGEVIIVTVGPESAAKDIRQAFAMGADRGVLINDEKLGEADNFVVASALVMAIKKIGDVDLILTGVQAEDDQASVTGMMIAAMLDLPGCSNVIKIVPDDSGSTLTLNRELEGGFNEILEVKTPALLTIQSGINDPRYPTLPGIMKAKKKPLEAETFTGLGLTVQSRTGLETVFVPQTESNVVILEGDAESTAKSLIDKLKNEVKVI